MKMSRLHHLATLCLLLVAASETRPSADLMQAAFDGSKWARDEAQRVEASLRQNSDDATARAKLLGFYSLRTAEDAARRLPHVLWMIQNHPTDPIAGSTYCRIDPDIDPGGFAQVRSIWQKNETKWPDDPLVLRNAAIFIAGVDDDEAERILSHGAELQPKQAEWSERLAAVYERKALRPGLPRADREKATWNALGQRERAYLLTHDASHRFQIFLEMPRDAVRAGDFLQAKKLAQQSLQMAVMLHDDPEYGTAVHVANNVLGRVALHTGDVDTANSFLLAAGKVPGSASLANAGPDMSLAKELLKRGQRRTVREYMDACERLWTSGGTRMRAWIATVDAGDVPDFGTQALE
jgi:hypothetical protein